MAELELSLLDDARRVRREFLITVEPCRPQLFAYCRALTSNVWDAEDLVQETLAKAFALAGSSHHPIRTPLPWMVRVATNAYIDSVRRARPILTDALDRPAPEAVDPVEVTEALEEVMTVLAPQERAAVVLKDVFDYPLAEIAVMVGTTTGAVKAALHRGRGKLADNDAHAVANRPPPQRAVLEAAAAAFAAYDAEALTAIFLADGEMSIVGMVYEAGPAQMRSGTLRHTFDTETEVRYSAEVRDFLGEPVIAVWSRRRDGSGVPGVCEVIRCRTHDGRLARMDDYFFCPEVVSEVAAVWGVPTVLHGYRYD